MVKKKSTLDINELAISISEKMEKDTKNLRLKDVLMGNIVEAHGEVIGGIGEAIGVTDLDNFKKFVAYNMISYKSEELVGRDVMTGSNKNIRPKVLERLRDAHGRGKDE